MRDLMFMPNLNHYQFEKPSEERWISIDFHVHSTYSGGSLSPAEILSYSNQLLLDAVAISDHHEVQGSLEGQNISMSNPDLPQIVTSQEVSAGDHFHLLLIGSKVKLPNLNRNLLINKIKDHRAAGGAAILAHPWTIPRWGKDYLKELLNEGLIDGIELFNSSIIEHSKESKTYLEYWWKDWVIPYNLAVVGGSDYHYIQKGRVIGGGRTYLRVKQLNEMGIVEALKLKQTVAGLFNCRDFDLDWIGNGCGLFLGQEPWLGEIKTMNAYLKEYIRENYHHEPLLKRFLNNLLDTGNFHRIQELFN